MVAHLVRLKLALLRNMFRRSRAQSIGAIVGILYLGFIVAVTAAGIGALRLSLADARLVIPLGGAIGVVLWTLVPLLAFGSDPTLDPQRFATFAVPPRQLAIGLVLAGLLGLPAIASTVLALATVVAWSYSVLATAVALLAAVVGVLTCVTLSRWVSAVATTALSSRRGRDLAGFVGVVALVAVAPIASLVGGASEDLRGTFETAATVAGWTPFGWIWAAPGDVAVGELGTGLTRLGLGVVFLGLVVGLWTRAVSAQVMNPRLVSAAGATRRDSGLGLFARLPDSPAGSVAARSLTYWLRDPRYQVSIVFTPFVPLALLVPYGAADIGWAPLLMAPLVAFLIGFSEHNSVSYDSTAFWLHVAAGLRGRDDRWGRILPSLMLATLLVPVYTGVGVWLGGRPDLLPAVLGLSLGLLGAGYAVSSILSVVLPYPVPKPGESPLSAPPGAAGMSMLAQTIASAAMLVLGAPVGVLAWLSWTGTGWAPWPAGLLGIVLGVSLTLVGIRVGGMVYDRRAPEVLSDLT